MRKALVLAIAWGLFGVVVGRWTAPTPAAADAPARSGDANGDSRIDLADAVYIINALFYGGPAPVPIDCPPAGGPALPATGQMKCYDGSGREIECASADYPGQDAIGCPMAGRFLDNSDGTATDACTGLMWQKDTADLDGDGWSRETDSVSWQSALKYCDELTLAGYEDWRLPSARELESLLDYGRFDPATDPVFEVVTRSYWSSSSFAGNPDSAWYVGFHSHFPVSYVEDKQQGYFLVRAVRNAR